MVVKKIILLFLLGWEVAANLSGSSSGHAIFAITYRGAVKELIFQVDRNAKAISPPPLLPSQGITTNGIQCKNVQFMLEYVHTIERKSFFFINVTFFFIIRLVWS